MAHVGSVNLSVALLRAQAPELVLRPGQVLAARVMERHGSKGLLALAGAVLTAELPEGVPEGARLRLTVQEASAQRVVLRMSDAPPAPAAPPVQLPLPDGRSASVRVDEREAQEGEEGDERRSVAVTYESPALGPVEFHLALGQGGGVSASVRAAAGPAHELADERAGELRDALAAATGRPASVVVTPRRDPIDLYA
jgi:hypothetical protein